MKKALYLIAFCIICTFSFELSLSAQDRCSTEVVNRTCKVVIDRLRPVQPPPIQMYPNEKIIVVIKHQFPFESPYLEWQSSTSTPAPDPTVSIVNTLLAQSKNFAFDLKTMADIINNPGGNAPQQPARAPVSCSHLPDQGDLTKEQILTCMMDFRDRSNRFYKMIEPFTNTNSVYPGLNPSFDDWESHSFSDWINSRLCDLYGTNTNAFNHAVVGCAYRDSILTNEQNLSNAIKGLLDQQGNLNDDIDDSITQSDAVLLSGLNAQADKVQQDLAAFGQRLLDLRQAITSGSAEVGSIVDPAPPKQPTGFILPSCNASASSNTPYEGKRRGFPFVVIRQVSCSLTVLNHVSTLAESVPTSQQKKTIVTITAVFGDSRVETSVGALFSYIPSRSFTAQPIFTTASLPNADHLVVQDQKVRPLVVPFGAVHFRIGDDFPFLGRRSAWYGTILTGLNPNTTTADFGTGVTFAWRSLMFTPLAHFTHDVRLTQGFTVGETLDQAFKGPVPTEKFWTTTFAFGISVRTSALTGR